MVVLVCATLCAAGVAACSAAPTGAQAVPGKSLFLPFIAGAPTLAGVYDCNEYEFGLIWTSEVVTLNPNGSSTYAYAPPYTQVVTGTWVYTPTAQVVGFTNFRWITATVTLPDRLSIRRYLPQAGFEIGMSCLKRPPTLSEADRRRESVSDNIHYSVRHNPRSNTKNTKWQLI